MNFLEQLVHMIQNPQQQPRRASQPHQNTNLLQQLRGEPEDAGYVQGPQGHYRLNADIGHFPMQPQGMPEDAGLIDGPQGYYPLNADIAHFNGPAQIQSGKRRLQAPPAHWQNFGRPRNYVNPQVQDNGYFYY